MFKNRKILETAKWFEWDKQKEQTGKKCLDIKWMINSSLIFEETDGTGLGRYRYLGFQVPGVWNLSSVVTNSWVVPHHKQSLAHTHFYTQLFFLSSRNGYLCALDRLHIFEKKKFLALPILMAHLDFGGVGWLWNYDRRICY